MPRCSPPTSTSPGSRASCGLSAPTSTFLSTSTFLVAAGYNQEMEEYEEVSVLVRSDAPWRIGGFGSCVGLLDDPTRLVVARLHPRPRTRPGLRLRPPQ